MTGHAPDKQRAVPRVLTIAGSDSGGGAGIQADIKVITSLGGYAMSAVTALTAQNTCGVWGMHPVPPDFVAQQVDVCLSDIGADAAKTGMLCNMDIVRAVAQVLRERGVKNLVVDPVMVSKSNDRLLDESAKSALIEEILPLATIVTPNLPEAAQLVGFEVTTVDDMRRVAAAILERGPRAVVVKGGHLTADSVDVFYNGKKFVEFPQTRIETKNTHGTGCSFSAALATFLAKGCSPLEAAGLAKRFITEAIRHSLPLGEGHGPTNPLAAAKSLDE